MVLASLSTTILYLFAIILYFYFDDPVRPVRAVDPVRAGAAGAASACR